MARLRSRLLALFVLGTLVWWTRPAAAAPRDELLRLVPDDATLCLAVQDLRARHQELAKAPWIPALRKTALGKIVMQGPELDKLLQAEKDLKQLAQIDWADVRDRILGDCVVFAFFHAAKNEDERGMVLMWVKDGALLDKLLRLINEKQQENKEVQNVQEKDYKGTKYVVRQLPNQNQFYWRKQALFVFTTQEALLRQVIDRQLAGPPPGGMPLVASFERLGPKPALVTLRINPRPFDVNWQPLPGDNVETVAAKQAFTPYWKALDALFLSLDAGQEMGIALTLQGRPKDLPKPAQKFLATAAVQSDLWRHFPTKAIFAAAGRVDTEALLQMLEEFLPASGRAKFRQNLQEQFGAALDMDFTKDALPYFGPDLGLCIAPNSSGKPVPDLLFALRVQSGNPQAPVDQAVLKALNTLAGVGKFTFNLRQKDVKDYMQLSSQQQDGVEVKYFAQREFPDGFQPAYALKNGYLVLASSPQAIQRFGPHGVKTEGNPLLRVSFVELGKFIAAQRERIVETFTDKGQLPRASTVKWLDDMLEVLKLCDSVQIRQELQPGQATWHVRLQMMPAQN
jgi:hypothetical protein